MNHHYIPQFYLRQWAGADQRLERYTQPIPGKIDVRRSYPSETGFERDLYRAPTDDPEDADHLEILFMQQLDSRAARVFEKLNAEPPVMLNAEERSTFSVFVRGLTYRSPAMFSALKESGKREWMKVVAEIKEEEYQNRRTPDDSQSLSDFRETLTEKWMENSVLNIVPNIFTSGEVGQALNNLHMRLLVMDPSLHQFLISDDPLVRTNGIHVENGHLALPISPRRLVVMAWKPETLTLITNQNPKALVSAVNRWVVEGARHFVGASDRLQDRFIRNRFGIDPKRPISG